MKEFILKQEMVFISTSDSKGECDCSLRTGKAGFVNILDEKRLIYAEFKGNGVMASMGNISENPHIGMLFVDFFKDKVGLHVNGKAKIIDTENLKTYFDNSTCERLKELEEYLGKKIVSWTLIEVEEAYIHCSKNIPIFKKNLDSSEMSSSDSVDYFNLEAIDKQ
jgi:predicted pyridoxine 5'-phosphate oxidase superfamily flavin-nucleotide-binding protein